jgi:hypothetical protein
MKSARLCSARPVHTTGKTVISSGSEEVNRERKLRNGIGQYGWTAIRGIVIQKENSKRDGNPMEALQQTGN